MRRLSPWWYLAPLAFAVVSVAWSGFAVGQASRWAVVRSAWIVRGYEAFPPGIPVTVVVVPEETRYLFASTPDEQVVPPSAVWCAVHPAPTSMATPRAQRLRDDIRVDVATTSGTWWLIGKVETTKPGQAQVTCRPRTPADQPGMQFAITPGIDGSHYASTARTIARDLALGAVGVLLAALAALVILAASLSAKTRVKPG